MRLELWARACPRLLLFIPAVITGTLSVKLPIGERPAVAGEHAASRSAAEFGGSRVPRSVSDRRFFSLFSQHLRGRMELRRDHDESKRNGEKRTRRDAMRLANLRATCSRSFAPKKKRKKKKRRRARERATSGPMRRDATTEGSQAE
ncbi:hypothetical protein PUN28_012259 [Cardiocondyla obscurior]|uniref:Transmembrane protein n=1 Tax=Cardiocondyla obscurior TaxID=286306 RepID=A0AAW2FFC8_9HYME